MDDANSSMWSEEHRHIVDGAQRLRREVLEPLERELDLLDHPGEADAHPNLEPAVQRALDMGLDRLGLPEEFGGLGVGLPVVLRVAEELAAGAPGFASRLLTQATVRTVLAGFVDASSGIRDVVGRDVAVGFVQPEAGAEGTIGVPGSEFGVRTRRYQLAREGEITWDGAAVHLADVRLNFVADGDHCDTLVLFVGSPSDGLAAYRVAVGPDGLVLNEPRARTLGLRLERRARLVLDGVQLSESDRLLVGEDAVRLLERLIVVTSMRLAAMAVGIASSAYDHAFDYTLTRVQGGKPIVEHQSVAATLWDGRASIETIRQAVAGATHISEGLPSLHVAAALRESATDMATRVSLDMLELLGGYGVTTEYPLEKLYRDARTLAGASGSLEGTGCYARVWLP